MKHVAHQLRIHLHLLQGTYPNIGHQIHRVSIRGESFHFPSTRARGINREYTRHVCRVYPDTHF